MLRGVIFDLDGTLGDTLPVCLESFRRVFKEYLDVSYTDSQIRSMFGPTEEGILEARIPDDGDGAVERYLQLYREAHYLVPAPFPGILEVLEALDARGIRRAIVTGKGPRSAALSLDYWGITDGFDPIEAGAAHGNVKDANMRRVLDAWHVPANVVASVDDATSDVHAAHANGITAVAAAWASTTDSDRLAAEAPDELFDTVAAFADWLNTR